MEATLKPQPLIAEVLPGLATICIFGTAYPANHLDQRSWLLENKSASEAITAGFATVLISWILGTFLDAIRDLLEHLIDWRFPVNWEFLFKGQAAEIQKLDDSWLAYYFLCGNYRIALAICGICAGLIGCVHLATIWIVIIFAAAIIFGSTQHLFETRFGRMSHP
jgi:hypothetical protein